MEKFLALLKSKKFWALVAAIVAALTAFFTTSCSASAKVQRSGIHIDTVRVDYIIRSRNTQITASCQTNQFNAIRPISILKSDPSIPVSWNSIISVPITSLQTVVSGGFLTPLVFPDLNYKSSSSLSLITMSTTITSSKPLSSRKILVCMSKPLYFTSGERCLALLLPIAFPIKSRRRGGRRGRPRPSGTKTVPLGGSHL